MKRHIGKLKTSDRRCVVINSMLPGKEDHALIVDTDSLPDRFHDSLMSIVESNEGQAIKVLGDLLSRRRYQDSGMDMLKTLHEAGRLKIVKNDEVVMYPMPNHPYLLKDIMENDPDYIDKFARTRELTAPTSREREVLDKENSLVIPKFKRAEEPALPPPVIDPTEVVDDYYFPQKARATPPVRSAEPQRAETAKDAARRLLIEAEMLELDAKRKRLEAYRMDLSLMPGVNDRIEEPKSEKYNPLLDAPKAKMPAPVTAPEPDMESLKAKVKAKIKSAEAREELPTNILTGEVEVKKSARGKKKVSIVG